MSVWNLAYLLIIKSGIHFKRLVSPKSSFVHYYINMALVWLRNKVKVWLTFHYYVISLTSKCFWLEIYTKSYSFNHETYLNDHVRQVLNLFHSMSPTLNRKFWQDDTKVCHRLGVVHSNFSLCFLGYQAYINDQVRQLLLEYRSDYGLFLSRLKFGYHSTINS